MRVPESMYQPASRLGGRARGFSRWLATHSTWAVVMLMIAGLVGVGLATSAGAVPDGGFVRGIYRFNSTDFAAMHAAGFNAATDGGVNALGQQEAAAGLNGMVWLSAYNNSSCAQTMSDSAITSVVRQNAQSGHSGLVYQVGDEPTTNHCPAAATYTHITQVIHAADPLAKSWVADDQYMDPSLIHSPIEMKGTVDILAFDVYPCQGSCDFGLIDTARTQILANIGNQQWQFIAQDFNAVGWTWPSPAALQAEFDHWAPALSSAHPPSGYWIFAWDYQHNDITAQSSFATLKHVNQNFASGASGPPVETTPTPTTEPTAKPTPGKSTPPPESDSPIPINGVPCAVTIEGKRETGVCSGSFTRSH